MAAENRPRRALVLQGGVALGAYEAGVISALCKEIGARIRDDENVFDIICGTSAGAINGAILVSYVADPKKVRQNMPLKERWFKAAEHLKQFWHYISSTPDLYYWWPYNSDIGRWKETWDDRSRMDNAVAKGEAARRYYSTKEFFYSGAPNVFSRSNVTHDNRFFDNLYPPTNTRYLYDNQPLRDSIVKFTDFGDAADFKLATSEARNEPRLITVAVDVREARAIAFDSYSTKSKYVELGDDNDSTYVEREISYDEGLNLQHVIASGTFPILFNYEKIQGREFWDGGQLSNTPLRELLQAHKEYHKPAVASMSYDARARSEIPDLELYVVNVWPSHESPEVNDYDGLKDRRNDIAYADKTENDLRVTLRITDYIDLFRRTKDVADDAIDAVTDPVKKREFKKKLDGILGDTAKSVSRTGERRKYVELVEGPVRIAKVTKIERRDDENGYNISNKWADFTSATISEMIQRGENYRETSLFKTLPS
jgi:NTE family protein